MDIIATNVDLALLKDQRNWLLDHLDLAQAEDGSTDAAEGLLNMLDHMIDKAEGVIK